MASDETTVVSVPAIVTEPETKYYGEIRDDIRPMEETVPLSAGGAVIEPEDPALADALLAWRESEPLPGELVVLYPPTPETVGRAALENDHLLIAGDGESPERVPLSALFADAAEVRVGYDASDDRTLAFALSGADGEPSLPLVLAVNAEPGSARAWYTATLGVDGASPPIRTTLFLAARDRTTLYLVTLAPAPDGSGVPQRSIWTVPIEVYRGEAVAVSRVGR